MPTNTSYNPVKISDFEKDKLLFNGQGSYGECSEGQTINIDLTLTDDHLITGGELIVKGGKFEDIVSFQVIYEETIIDQFITNYYIKEDVQSQFTKTIEYPAKLVAGLTLRCVYTATAEVGVRDICINYDLHMVIL
jgi:hypothetical protein